MLPPQAGGYPPPENFSTQPPGNSTQQAGSAMQGYQALYGMGAPYEYGYGYNYPPYNPTSVRHLHFLPLFFPFSYFRNLLLTLDFYASNQTIVFLYSFLTTFLSFFAEEEKKCLINFLYLSINIKI
jgi:hypothetical protein